MGTYESSIKREIEQATKQFNDEAQRIRKEYLDKMNIIVSKCTHCYDDGTSAIITNLNNKEVHSCTICGKEVPRRDSIQINLFETL